MIIYKTYRYTNVLFPHDERDHEMGMGMEWIGLDWVGSNTQAGERISRLKWMGRCGLIMT